MLFARVLKHIVNAGRIKVIDANGEEHIVAGTTGSSVTIRLHDSSLHWKLFINPGLYLGEAYMNGTLTIEDGDIYDFLQFATRNMEKSGEHPVMDWISRADSLFRRIQQFNPADRSKRNVAHHYDLSGELYDLFLDSDRQYSCAYFEGPNDDLETAQYNKKRHIAAKLMLEPDMEVLDIGSGWGGLGLFLAEECGARVTGLTLSEEQLAVARERARQRGLEDRVSFHLRDYRAQSGSFDRIVSVGMFEHVGVTHYGQHFNAVNELLNDDGVALIHTIGRTGVPRATNPWIRKYIFPGGYIPALSEMMRRIESSRLVTCDVEVLRLHYAETLRFWRERFSRNRDRAKKIYDETFCRMWEYYLAASEVSFRHMDNVVFQVQLAKDRGVLPLTRDYIHEWESRPVPSGNEAKGGGAAA